MTKLEDTDEASARVWSSLPGFQWYAPALRAKVGTEVLATHATETNRFGRVPLIVTKTFGAGKILFMGTDGAWRWRRGVEDKYHYRFWGQVARWMAYQRNMAQGDKMRLFYSPDRPRTGAVLTLNANVTSLTGEPLRDGVVIAQLTAPSGKTESVRLVSAGEDAWGLFTGVFTPREPGEYHLRLTVRMPGRRWMRSFPSRVPAAKGSDSRRSSTSCGRLRSSPGARMMENADPATVVSAIAALPHRNFRSAGSSSGRTQPGRDF